MQYEKHTIKVRQKLAIVPSGVIEVEAVLVGGTEGVFAVWRDGDLICLAAGDDGEWWELTRYHVNWATDILCAIGSVV